MNRITASSIATSLSTASKRVIQITMQIDRSLSISSSFRSSSFTYNLQNTQHHTMSHSKANQSVVAKSVSTVQFHNQSNDTKRKCHLTNRQAIVQSNKRSNTECVCHLRQDDKSSTFLSKVVTLNQSCLIHHNKTVFQKSQ